MTTFTFDRPMVAFDLETTGTNPAMDCIITMGVIKILPDGTRDKKHFIFNPTIPIPAEATAIHNLIDEQVQSLKTFKEQAHLFYKAFAGCDLLGFNIIGFDIPLLAKEFARCGLEFPYPDTRVIDVMSIYHYYERRNLAAAYHHYLGKPLTAAHHAETDIEATVQIFFKQLEHHITLPRSIKEVHEFCMKSKHTVDWSGKLRKDETGEICYNFGKHAGKKVADEPDYAKWILDSDFPLDVQKIIRQVLEKKATV